MRLNPLQLFCKTIPGAAQFVEGLQIHPETFCGAEKLGESNCRVRRNPALFKNDVVDSRRGHTKLLGEFIGRHLQRLEKFLPQNFSWMNLPCAAAAHLFSLWPGHLQSPMQIMSFVALWLRQI